MKSSDSDLRQRGKASKEDLYRYQGCSMDELIVVLQSGEPHFRSAAAANLAKYVNQAAPMLLSCLEHEKTLYTRLAICEALEQGNSDTAKKMTSYLGRIGKNQHNKLPNKVSVKKSFPLPRDLIARTLGRMDASILPVMLEVLSSGTKEQVYEVIDAIGYLIFYHQELATLQNCQNILKIIERYGEDEIILWKTLICLSAFSDIEAERFLENHTNQSTLLGKEAQRSLDIIKERNLKKLRREQANPDCPCRWRNCSRFGLCDECREHHCHSEKHPLPACDRKKTKKL